jgi:SNF2 family DNA or RNA helicase
MSFKPSKPLWDGFQYYAHQVEAVDWLVRKETVGTPFDGTLIRGGLLADDMGLGKTIELTGLIVENQVERTLLVVPAPLMKQWENVLKRADLNVFTAAEDRWVNVSPGASYYPAVYLVNYEKTYSSCFSLVLSESFDRVILDEAHRIRNSSGAAGAVCGAIKAPLRWAVTGTPVVNSLKDVVALFRFIGLRRPTNKWEKEYEALAANLTLRRSIEDMRGVLPDVPPEPVFHEEVLKFQTAEEKAFYRGVQTVAMKSEMALLKLLRLRQISVHPQVYVESTSSEQPAWTLPVTKFEAIRRLLSADSADEPHKYIFMCHFKEEIALLKKFLNENGLVDDVFTYDGSMSKKTQELSLAMAKRAPGRTALLLQIQAGGVGLNLQEFDRVIFLSGWWTAALMEQAIARAYRIGQKKVVHVYKLILAEEKTTNIDRKILGMVNGKKAIADKFFSYLSD